MITLSPWGTRCYLNIGKVTLKIIRVYRISLVWIARWSTSAYEGRHRTKPLPQPPGDRSAVIESLPKAAVDASSTRPYLYENLEIFAYSVVK